MITSYTTSRSGNTTRVTVISSLSGLVYYFWYQDGAYVATTTIPHMAFVLQAGQQAKIVCIDQNTSTPPAAPDGYPARRKLFWIRAAGSIARYRVDQQENGGAWSTLGYVTPKYNQWSYSFTTPTLDDLATYNWRIVPLDSAGNAGTPLTIATETIVRTPDSPDFSISYNPSTSKVTFGAA